VDTGKDKTMSKKSAAVFFGNKIRIERMARGLTKSGLADELGVSVGSVTNWENGTNPPSDPAIKKLFKTFPQLDETKMNATVNKPHHSTYELAEAVANVMREPAKMQNFIKLLKAARYASLSVSKLLELFDPKSEA
jgi:transcriptional regulator with XRE-family HTH domain